MRIGKALALVVVSCLLAACGSGNSALTPQRSFTNPTTAPSSKPTTKPTASPVPTATPTVAPGGLSVAEVNAALANTQQYYATLPHTNVVADLAALAKQMVSSGLYQTALVTPGGITATLSDGETALIYADVPEDFATGSAAATAAQRSRERATVAPVRFDKHGFVPHEYAFLANTTDPNFLPGIDQQWATAFQTVPFMSSTAASTQYAADEAPVSLDSILYLASFPLDFLDISTHGLVAMRTMGAPSQYYMLSTTKYDSTSKTTYAADFTAGNLAYGLFLSTDPTTASTNDYAYISFTPGFLTSHLHFNPGAVVNLGSCYSQSPTIASIVGSTFQAAGIGRYFGWTKAVGIVDMYQSYSFLYDRLLGEQSPSTTGLNSYAAQRTPPQRPFNLDDVHNVMETEMRSSAIEPAKSQTYAESDVGFAPNATQPPLSDGTLARYLETDFGAEGLSTAPLIYGFPSIASLSIVESASSGTLTLTGEFPPAQGTVQITDASGTTQLTVTSWGLTSVTATLPAGGNGSSGMVTAVSANGVLSNAVPLTKWSGTLTYNENDEIPDLDGTSGSGSGSISAQFNIDFRADVHSVVPTIDTSPSPLPFYFTFTEGDSTAQLTSYSGTYTSSGSSPHTAVFSLASPAPILNAATPPLQDNTFEVRSFANQPAPCNYGTATAPAAGSGLNANVFCPLAGFLADSSQIICSDDDAGALCSDNGFAGLVAYSGPYDAMGLLSLTLDPATYQIAVAGTTSEFTSAQFYDTDRPATASMSGTISAPSYPPTTTTPALRKPAIPKIIHRTSLGQIAPDQAKYAAAYRLQRTRR